MSNYQGFRDLIVYQKSYKLAMVIFEIAKSYPKEEKYLWLIRSYDLPDQFLQTFLRPGLKGNTQNHLSVNYSIPLLKLEKPKSGLICQKIVNILTINYITLSLKDVRKLQKC